MKKWNDLAEEIKKEPMMLKLRARITGEALKEIAEEGRAIVREINGEIIAFRGLWKTDFGDFFEMGSFWVKPIFRNKGIGSQIMREIYLIFPKGKVVFVITRNPKVAHLLRKHRWKEATPKNWKDVVPFEISCGPCNEVSLNCPKMAKENKCLLFYFKN
jgi:GNAT superfamily N-acetyltransferase